MHLALPIELIDIIIEKYLEDFEMSDDFGQLEYDSESNCTPVGYDIDGEPQYEIYLSKDLRCYIFESKYCPDLGCYAHDNTCGKIRLKKFNSRRKNLNLLYQLSLEDKNHIYKYLMRHYNLNINEINNMNKNIIEKCKEYDACYHPDCECFNNNDYSCAHYTERNINEYIDRIKIINNFRKELDKIDALFKIVGE